MIGVNTHSNTCAYQYLCVDSGVEVDYNNEKIIQ